ncbi:MAG: hypothetical protein ABI481_01860 [Pyrinomonadaceae bacterium]
MNSRMMKRILSASITLFTLVAFAQLTSYSQKSADEAESDFSQLSLADGGKGSRAIEGTWNALVTIRNCQTGDAIAAFKAMDLFIQGGAVVDTNSAPPNTRGPGFGSWEFVGNQNFRSTIRFFLYSPDGSFAGVRRIAQNISLDEENNSWMSSVAITVYDPAGNLVTTACATSMATRAQ